MIFGLPSGIGDFSWAYSKLCNAGPLDYEIADGWPYRTVPYLELLPQVATAKYGDFTYDTIVAFEKVNELDRDLTWEQLKKLGYGKVLIQPNHHLERGKRLEEWLPDLPTTFHYPIVTTDRHKERARRLLEGMPRPLVGISAASYRGSEAWKTWGAEEWKDFLAWWSAEVGGTVVLLGGFWDDLTAMLAEEGYEDLVGKTDVGTMVEVQKILDYYVGFSSGLGVIRTVLGKNVYMFWPDHQVALSTSWAPPVMLGTGAYSCNVWQSVDNTKLLVTRWLKEVSCG